jgi:hypothetical protein
LLYSTPTFWLHREAGAVPSSGSDDDARHRGHVAPKQESKTWRAKPGCVLTASGLSVLKAINEIWPDGTMDHKAKARNERILNQLKIAKQAPVSSRTIQRTLKKILFR